jgi:uncharacterized protein YbaR (Trm112 family)
MTAERSDAVQVATIDRGILGQLACPVCFGALGFAADTVVCAGCGRIYPLIDGIPVLIAERAARCREDALDQARSIGNPGNADS